MSTADRPFRFCGDDRAAMDVARAVQSSRDTMRLRVLGPEDRPQDPTLDGSMLLITTHEHGGAEPDTMPQALRVTDIKGRTAIYVPLKFAGHIVEVLPT